VQKDPARRLRIKDALLHPFINKVDLSKPASWPFEMFGGEREMADLDIILQVVCVVTLLLHGCYTVVTLLLPCQVLCERGYPDGAKAYKRSFFELARFQRLAKQLGFEAVGGRLSADCWLLSAVCCLPVYCLLSAPSSAHPPLPLCPGGHPEALREDAGLRQRGRGVQ
jgi:hypothetical protein